MLRAHLLVLTLCFFLQSNAQEKLDYVFNHLDASSGFPAKTVRQMACDKEGLLWMLTDKGLMRYNGHSAKFYTAKKDSSGLLNKPVYSLYIDKKGIIWIGYLEVCLSSFDPKTEKFTHYYYDEKDETSYPPGGAVHFMEDKKGELWIAVWGGGLSHFNRKTGKFKTYRPDANNPKAISTHNTTYVVELPDGKFMVGSWEGEKFKNFLQYFDPVKEEFTRFDIEPYSFTSESEKNGIQSALRIIHFIYPDTKNKKTWIGTFVGLVCIDEEAKTIRRHSGVGGTIEGSGKYENAMDYVVDNTGKLWISTEVTGIMVIDPITKLCGYLNHQYKNSASISGDNIFSMFRDEDDNIWVTTTGGGIDVYTPLLQQFKFIDNETLGAERANRAQGQTALMQVTLSKDSRDIYLAHGSGLTVYNPTLDSIYRINTREIYLKNQKRLTGKSMSQAPNHVFSIVEDNGKLLICTGDGLLVYNKTTKQYSLPDFEKYEFIDINRNKTGYVATARAKTATDWNARLVQMDTNFNVKKELHYPEWPFKDLLGHYNARYIVPLGEHDWYINFNQRLFYIFNETKGEFKSYCSRPECNNNFPDSALTPLIKDKNDNLWISGNNGVYKFDYRSGKTEKYNDIFKIGKEQVFNLTIDSSGIFWIALKQDLVRYDPKNGETFRYTQKLGLNVGGFSRVTSSINNRSELYILSSYGLLHFDPKALNFSRQRPDIFISGIVINKDTLHPGALDTFLNSGSVLRYNQNHLTIEYATYQLYSPGPKKYEYRLSGLDSTWYNNENRNYVTYPALSSGTYTLELKCRNVYGVNSHVFRFMFTINPPFWKTWWFIVCEIILLVLAIGLFIKTREKKLQADKLKLEKVVTERTKEVVEKAKEIELQNEIIFEKNKELTDSIRYAERIQKALLAHSEFMGEHLPEHFVFFKPKAIVSGDFYWATFIKTPATTGTRELFYLAVCDCTGHGVPGAFMSLLNISFLNEAISEKNILEPNKVLDYVRTRLIESLSAEKGQDGMDGTLMCYDKTKKQITYASAHNKPLLIRNGAMQELSADKMPVGKGEKEEPFTLHTIQLQKNDLIYFYSDGYADQFGGPKGKKFKYKQLNELLLSLSTKPIPTQHQVLDEVFEDWKGHLEQIDDVLVIGMKIS